MKALVNSVRAFAREEDGIALTEYLVLLGLLVGGVITAVATVSGNLSTAWTSWGTFFTGNLSCANPNSDTCV
jgi:pilus assembly protein Flp/PilA